jgi:hypothetical protein
MPDDLVCRPNVDLDLPRADLAGCATAFAGVAYVFGQVGGLNLVILPALGHRRQGILGCLGRWWG